MEGKKEKKIQSGMQRWIGVKESETMMAKWIKRQICTHPNRREREEKIPNNLQVKSKLKV